MDFMTRKSREFLGHMRDIDKEKRIELEITKILGENFSFRFIVVDDRVKRMGSKGLESRLISTVANCNFCKPSGEWLGKYSPIQKIKGSGLWQVQHLKANPIMEEDKKIILNAIELTKERCSFF